jgi:hypothetical protein
LLVFPNFISVDLIYAFREVNHQKRVKMISNNWGIICQMLTMITEHDYGCII